MSILNVNASSITAKKVVSGSIEVKNDLKVLNEIISQTIYSDTIKTGNLYIDKLSCISMNAA